MICKGSGKSASDPLLQAITWQALVFETRFPEPAAAVRLRPLGVVMQHYPHPTDLQASHTMRLRNSSSIARDYWFVCPRFRECTTSVEFAPLRSQPHLRSIMTIVPEFLRLIPATSFGEEGQTDLPAERTNRSMSVPDPWSVRVDRTAAKQRARTVDRDRFLRPVVFWPTDRTTTMKDFEVSPVFPF